MPNESPLKDYIVAMKHILMKVAVQKLSKFVKLEESKAKEDIDLPNTPSLFNTPKAVQTLFTSLMDNIRPYLKKNETR